MAETLQSRSRRILCLIGWVRDETLRLIEDWDGTQTRSVVSKRLKAVSSFLDQDIDALLLRTEYDNVERLVVDAIDSFPSIGAPDLRYHQRDLGEGLLRGRYRANPDVLHGLLHEIPRELRDECSCSACRYFWDTRPYWRDSYYWSERYEYGYQGYPYGCVGAWAVGVAEASTAFEEMIRGLDPTGPLR